MYMRMLIPLDGSKVAEQVLPYARFLAKGLVIPVELLGVVDPEALVAFSNPAQGPPPRHTRGGNNEPCGYIS
jgi:nucleotide-binding universal stress UspA family protein